MKIIAFGDIHGATVNLIKLAREFDAADGIVFVGDGAGDLHVLSADMRRKLVAVRGNCDFFCGLPIESNTLSNTPSAASGVCHPFVSKGNIWVTHGHKYDVKAGLGALVAAARARGAKVCLFGHNHRPSCDVIDGITFVNPGTLGNTRTAVPNSYAVVTIDGDAVKVEHQTI